MTILMTLALAAFVALAMYGIYVLAFVWPREFSAAADLAATYEDADARYAEWRKATLDDWCEPGDDREAVGRALDKTLMASTTQVRFAAGDVAAALLRARS